MKRSVRIAGHHTSVSLEEEFWVELKKIAVERKLSVNDLVAKTDAGRKGNLSSALRLLVLERLRAK